MGVNPRSGNDNLEVALVLLGAAESEALVVAIVRDYVASKPAAREWIHGEVRDAGDLASCAVDLARVRMQLDHASVTLADLEVLFARACVRLAALLGRPGPGLAREAQRLRDEERRGRNRDAR